MITFGMTAQTATSAPAFTKNDAEFFFQDPLVERATEQTLAKSAHSTLCSLRGDIDFCMQIDRLNQKPLDVLSRAVWPGAMTIMAGIDLLAKFYEGNDDTSPRGIVGTRFRAFLAKFLGVNQSDQDILYKLRNSLVHSFGISAIIEGSHIDLAFGQYQLVVSQCSPDRKAVDLWVLYLRFEKAVYAYRDAVTFDSTLQRNFAKMFSKYGSFSTYVAPRPTTANGNLQTTIGPIFPQTASLSSTAHPPF
jgi:hypothetical protein